MIIIIKKFDFTLSYTKTQQELNSLSHVGVSNIVLLVTTTSGVTEFTKRF